MTATTMIYHDSGEATTALTMMISSCSLAPLGSGASAFCSSTMIDVCPAICVNGRRAPTERLTARVMDPFSLANMGGEDMDVDVVDLSSKSKLLRRLVGPAGIIEGPEGWWMSNSKAILLLCEIKDEIK